MRCYAGRAATVPLTLPIANSLCPISIGSHYSPASTGPTCHIIIPAVMPRHASPCSLCDKVFSTAFNLSVHVRVHHMQVKNFQCQFCGRKFGYKHTLRNHTYVHRKDPKDCWVVLSSAIRSMSALLSQHEIARPTEDSRSENVRKVGQSEATVATACP